MRGAHTLGDEFYQTYKESMLEVHVHLHISESLYIYVKKSYEILNQVKWTIAFPFLRAVKWLL